MLCVSLKVCGSFIPINHFSKHLKQGSVPLSLVLPLSPFPLRIVFHLFNSFHHAFSHILLAGEPIHRSSQTVATQCNWINYHPETINN